MLHHRVRREHVSVRGVLTALTALPWAAWAVVRAFGLEVGHPGVPAMAFTPYVAASAWIPVVVAAALRRWVVTVVAAATAVTLVAIVVPRALPGPDRTTRTAGSISVMTANLGYGKADAGAVMRLVAAHGVDVLALEEMTPQVVERLDRAGARSVFPYRVLDARPGARGSGLLSRSPLAEARRPATTRMAMPEARLALRGRAPVDVKVVHPPAPLRGDVPVWRRELRGLPRSTPDGGLRMVVGDFNATLDHRELRDLLDSGYVDAADAAGGGLHGTYRSGRRFPPMVAIDHVLVDRRIGVAEATVLTLPGSDHRTLIATLVLPPPRR